MLNKSTWWRVRLWIACCAILLNALAPSVSHALNAERGYLPIADICTANDSYDTEQRFHLLADCEYCVQHGGDLFTPPSSPLPGLPASHGHPASPSYHAPQPLLALCAAAPRGPPAR